MTFTYYSESDNMSFNTKKSIKIITFCMAAVLLSGTAAAAALRYDKPREAEPRTSIKDYIKVNESERPLETLVSDGGYCGIFRTVGVIGDSLSSGEFEGTDENGNTTWTDMYDYSWGQVMARDTGRKVYNFSKGGLTAEGFLTWASDMASNPDKLGFGAFDDDKKCQAYIIALGVNDLLVRKETVGTTADININNPEQNAKTFAGWYGKIISKLKAIQPEARIFLMTMPQDGDDSEDVKNLKLEHKSLLFDMKELFGKYTYVLDFNTYAPVHDREFKNQYYLGNHMNPAGYVQTARMVESYIDYIIRHNSADFAKVGFVGSNIKH